MSAAPATRPMRATIASPMPAHPGSGLSLVNGTVTAKGGLSVGGSVPTSADAGPLAPTRSRISALRKTGVVLRSSFAAT